MAEEATELEVEPVDATVADDVADVETDEVDTEAVEAEATDDGEVVAQSQDEGEPEESSTSNEVPKERIEEVTKLRREAERDRDYWKNMAQQQKAAPNPVEPGKTLGDFDYDEGKYTEYLTDLANANAAAETQRVIEQERGASIQADFQARESDFSSTVKDYHTATTSDSLQFSQDMAAATMHAEKGPALRYYLAKNPEISARLSRMSSSDMLMELGRIDATKLGKQNTSSVTKAPKPVPKIAAATSKATLKITDPKLSDSQFRKLRQKQIANR